MTNVKRDVGVLGAQVALAASRLDADELEILLFVAQGLLVGKAQFGTLEVESDGRDFAVEALEEVRDALVYVGAKLLKVRHA